MAFKTVEIVIVTLMCCAASVHYVHVLQMHRYQTPTYWHWLHRIRNRIILENVALAFVTALISLYLPVFLSLFFNREATQQSLANWLALVLFVAVTGRIFYRDFNAPSKKPFVMTRRMQRLSVLIAVLALLMAVLLRLMTIPPHFLFAMMPYLVMVASLIINPYENKLNAGYFREAKEKIRSRSDLITIGITGSFGKTNVKFMLRDILSKKYKVLATPASFNTAMGISRVINDDLTDEHQVFIAEMGATHVGDIKRLVELVRPKYGILTNIGPRHLDTFGSLENIASTKYELIQGLPRDGGIAIFGSGDDYVDRLFAMCRKEKYRVSLDPAVNDAFMTAEGIAYSDRGTGFVMVCRDGGRISCHTKLLGAFNVRNLLMAAALARKMGMELNEIAAAIRGVEPIEHRLCLKTGDLNVIDDTLNEDPDGAFEAMHVIAQMPGRRIVVTPGLDNLGTREGETNYALGTVMADSADTVILVGQQNSQRGVRRGLLQSGFSRTNLHLVDDMDSVSELLEEITEIGDTVLFESSISEDEE